MKSSNKPYRRTIHKVFSWLAAVSAFANFECKGCLVLVRLAYLDRGYKTSSLDLAILTL